MVLLYDTLKRTLDASNTKKETGIPNGKLGATDGPRKKARLRELGTTWETIYYSSNIDTEEYEYNIACDPTSHWTKECTETPTGNKGKKK